MIPLAYFNSTAVITGLVLEELIFDELGSSRLGHDDVDATTIVDCVIALEKFVWKVTMASPR